MNSVQLIDGLWKHADHPDLHALVKLRIFIRRKTWHRGHHVFMDDGSCGVTVRYLVPDHIAFEDIEGLVKNVYTSQGPIKWWELYQEQNPEAWKITYGCDQNPGVGVIGIEGYVHGDGSPYDVIPLQSDYMKRRLNDSHSRNVINSLTEEGPEDRLFVELQLNVNIWHNPSCDDDHGGEQKRMDIEPITLVVDVTHAEYGQVKDPSWWDNYGEERIDAALSRDFPAVYAELQKACEGEMIDVSYSVERVKFIDYFHNPVDTSTVEFKRKVMGQILGA